MPKILMYFSYRFGVTGHALGIPFYSDWPASEPAAKERASECAVFLLGILSAPWT